ncbi:hypothetical protein IF129_03200 [Streptomyces chumphonensis]|uniref:Small secreted hydrophilic protein n=1 Tax=Streptomyces chumphonensis TaxID=1214925 RepID=A0A927EX26_9ACTN|nr:hypothetical protein [Streptomyces chumphonensis]MBD3930582.1 hypothetical protein [Streptomyces chumphonensis]
MTCIFAALLAVGAGVGIVAMLNADTEQPNVPLVHFPDHEPEAPSPPAESVSPSEATDPSAEPADGAENASEDEGGDESAEPTERPDGPAEDGTS